MSKQPIRIFFLGFLIIFVGVGVNKVLGIVDFGVVITFSGFGICIIGMVILAVMYIKEVFR